MAWGGGRLRAGLAEGAGPLLAAACLVKWTAPAFYGPVLAVALQGR